MKERFAELEKRLMYQEDTLAKLDLVVREQQMMIEKLMQQIKKLSEGVEGLEKTVE